MRKAPFSKLPLDPKWHINVLWVVGWWVFISYMIFR